MTIIPLDTYINTITELIDKGAFSQAANHCHYLLRQYPKLYALYEALGRLYFEQDNLSSALDVFLRKLSVAPSDFLNHLTLGLVYEEQNNEKAAIFHIKTALELKPDNKDIFTHYHSMIENVAPSV